MYLIKILIIFSLLFIGNLDGNVEIFPGAYLERLPASTLYEATSPLLFKIAHSKLECNQTSDVCNLTNVLFTDSLLLKPESKTRETLLNDDGERGTYSELTRKHVRRLFTDLAEVQRLINFAHTRNFTITDVSLMSSKGTKLEQLFVMKLKLRFLVSMCQNKRLRPGIISPVLLKHELGEFRKYWSNAGYTEAIEILSQYYDLPLIECVITNNLTLIGVHVPLVQIKTKGMNLYRLMTPSFSWGDHACSIHLEVVDLALDHPEDPKSILIPDCNPSKDEICPLKDPTGLHLRSILCAQRVLKDGTIKEIATACPLTCELAGTDIQYVTVLSRNVYLINPINENSTVVCKGVPTKISNTPIIGTTKIALPCHCHVTFVNNGNLRGGQGCNGSQTLKINQVIPAAWSSIDSLRIPPYNQPKPTFQRLEECLNQQWMKQHLGERTQILLHFLIFSPTCLILGLLLAMNHYWHLKFQMLKRASPRLQRSISGQSSTRRPS